MRMTLLSALFAFGRWGSGHLGRERAPAAAINGAANCFLGATSASGDCRKAQTLPSSAVAASAPTAGGAATGNASARRY